MKKLLVLFLLLMTTNYAYSAPTQSTNPFPLTLEAKDIPSGGGGGGSNGTSAGAIVGIAAGSVGAASLSGLGVLMYKAYFLQGLLTGGAVGINEPILPMCIDKKYTDELICKYPQYTLLKKALAQDTIRECPCSKYILIPDTEIKNYTFDTIVFEIPENMPNIKITQATCDNQRYIKHDLYISSDKKDNVRLNVLKSDMTNGILIENTSITNSKKGYLIITFKKPAVINKNVQNQKYAFVIEFYK